MSLHRNAMPSMNGPRFKGLEIGFYNAIPGHAASFLVDLSHPEDKTRKQDGVTVNCSLIGTSPKVAALSRVLCEKSPNLKALRDKVCEVVADLFAQVRPGGALTDLDTSSQDATGKFGPKQLSGLELLKQKVAQYPQAPNVLAEKAKPNYWPGGAASKPNFSLSLPQTELDLAHSGAPADVPVKPARQTRTKAPKPGGRTPKPKKG